MSNETEQDLEAAVQPPEPEHIELSTPAPLRFAPWHKPRKQFIRNEQWIRHVKGIIERSDNFRDGRPFSYLTLPGPDLLDVRLVADVCRSQGIKLRYLGFCRANEDETQRLRINVSEFGISRTESVSSGSKVVIAPIQDIQIRKSEAYVALSQGGTYDAINIDACNPIARGDIDTTGRLIDTIRHLADYQINKRRELWVLFLTTPIQNDSISDQSLGAIYKEIERNNEKSDEFADEMRDQFAEGEDIQSYMERISRSTSREFLSLVSLGLTKWLIHLGEQGHYRVKIMKSFCYSTYTQEPFTPNMASLCFLFEPTAMPINDATGLTANRNQNIGGNIGIEDHIRALRKTNEIANVDEILYADRCLREEMISDTKTLLRQAGYPVDDVAMGYNAWLANNP